MNASTVMKMLEYDIFIKDYEAAFMELNKGD